MMRAWIGVALLSVSWLLGSGFYYPANRLAWAIVVAAGAILLGGTIRRLPSGREAMIALALAIPMVWFAPWPLRAAPLLVVTGLALTLMPIPRRWTKSLGRGAVAAGVVMLAQALVMALYASQTARSHELPWPLPEALAGLAGLSGIEATADGSTIAIHSIRQVHRLGATWELLVDPATLCFFVGSVVLLGLIVWSRLPGGRRLAAWGAALQVLTLAVLAWLPIRAGLMIGLYVHRVLRADPDTPLHVMNHFLSPWVLLLLLLGPVLLAWRFVRLPASQSPIPDRESRINAGQAPPLNHTDNPPPLNHTDNPPPLNDTDNPKSPIPNPKSQLPAAAGLVLLAVAVFTVAIQWDPVGERKGGRVMFVERHSTWEPTTRPHDTTWFGHDSGYNYRAVYDYCSQYFEMSRLLESDQINGRTLDGCDVLVIKIPTARYSEEEVRAVVRFVERGGGLLLVGDHTNVFNSGTYLNDITRKMGFTFRDDLLFGTGDSPYDQLYCPPRVPHPVVQHLGPTDFAVSCSIDPGHSRGRAVIQSTGLWSLPPDYHLSNYHTVPQQRADMRYGAFIQLWSTRHGDGRVLAFTDSTIFSNFCVFQPGKAELFLGMIEWLNHDGPVDPRPWLLLLGVVPLAGGLYLARGRDGSWLVLAAAGTCGWVAACVAVAAAGRCQMPVPKADRPQSRVMVDRTTSDVPLSKGYDIRGNQQWDRGRGFGLFEQWISRVDVPGGKLHTMRASGPEAFSGKALVVICPGRSVSRQYRQQLVKYVKQDGGKLLVIDSPENALSTANSLLWPFGLSVRHDRIVTSSPDAPARLIITDDWPDIEIGRACRVTGGRSVAQVGETCVGARAEFDGGGAVMALGFASEFNDVNYGGSWMVLPTADEIFDSNTYVRYNVQFAFLEALMTGRPVEKCFMGRVVIDRTVSEVSVSEGDSDRYEDDRFGAFEDWFWYFGYSVAHGAVNEAISGDALVILYPNREVTDQFRENLARYVDGGGKLLIVDSPENKESTSGDLLEPFGLSLDRTEQHQGELLVADSEQERWLELTVEAAWKVDGGEPFAELDDSTPIGVLARHGRGTVAVVGFGSVFNNAGMRASWEAEQPARLLAPANLEAAILQALLTGQSVEKCVPSISNEP